MISIIGNYHNHAVLILSVPGIIFQTIGKFAEKFRSFADDLERQIKRVKK